VTTWVHLGAFTQVPKPEVKEFVQKNSSVRFGTYEVKTFTMYLSTNKWLANPTKIIEFPCAE